MSYNSNKEEIPQELLKATTSSDPNFPRYSADMVESRNIRKEQESVESVRAKFAQISKEQPELAQKLRLDKRDPVIVGEVAFMMG